MLIGAGSARAYSDPASFDLSPLAAGGGGRFFTGSPADGYTCKVCHEGGAEPRVSVLGLPLAGYRPGESYEVTVEWSEQLEKVALALELSDGLGKAAGRIRLPQGAEIEEPELCEPVGDGWLAAQLTELSSERQIIQVPDCGAKRVRFLWTAPSDAVGQVWFAGSMVASDGESDPHHDGVTDFGRALGTSALASETTAQCSAAFGGTTRNRSAAVLIALAALLCWIRRRHRCASQDVRPHAARLL
jgi:hypothetical protein